MARSDGAALLDLQRIDLELAREKAQAARPAELERLKSLLATSKRVQALITQLTGRVKDAEMELSELSAEQESLRCEVDELKERARTEAMDHRQQAWANEQHASLMKRLDKAEFKGEEALEILDALTSKRNEAIAAKERLDREVSKVKSDTRGSVERAQAAISRLEDERGALVSSLDPSIVNAYERASARFEGLAVEELHGNHPSICRMALEPRAVQEAWRDAPITQCPYCRRILIVGEEEG